MLTENQLIELLAAYFEKKQFKIIQKLTSIQKGIDLIVESPAGIRHEIEAKGETSGSIKSKRYGKPFSGNQIWSHVSVALLKTLTILNTDRVGQTEFGMAFPENHRELIIKIKPSLDLLKITVYLISESGVSVL